MVRDNGEQVLGALQIMDSGVGRSGENANR